MSKKRHPHPPANITRPPVKRDTREIVAKGFSGPIPPPDILQGYEVICTGAADRIILMAEKQEKHRHEMEKRGQKGLFISEYLGAIFAFLVCVLAIGGAVFCIIKGHSITGTIIGSFPLASVVYYFVLGRGSYSSKSSRNDR